MTEKRIGRSGGVKCWTGSGSSWNWEEIYDDVGRKWQIVWLSNFLAGVVSLSGPRNSCTDLLTRFKLTAVFLKPCPLSNNVKFLTFLLNLTLAIILPVSWVGRVPLSVGACCSEIQRVTQWTVQVSLPQIHNSTTPKGPRHLNIHRAIK